MTPEELQPFVSVILQPRPPTLGLAEEELYFNQVAQGSIHLRLTVNTDSVIIGKHQNPWLETNIPWLQRENIPLLRRISGGGSVFHDQGNLNYCFMCETKYFNKEENLNFLVSTLHELGIPAHKNSRGDLLVFDKKISGNALCHKNGKTLHHGTLLVNANLKKLRESLNHNWNKALEFDSPTVKSVPMSVTNIQDIAAHVSIESISHALVENWSKKHHTNLRSMDNTYRVDTTLYETWDWNFGRTSSFQVRHGDLLVKVEQGRMNTGETFDSWLQSNSLIA